VVSGGAGGNDFAGTLFPGLQIGGFFGSQILFNMPAGTAVRVDFLGAEAGFEDGFGFSNAQFIHNGGVEMAAGMAAPLSSVMVSAAGPGLLPFAFKINQNAARPERLQPERLVRRFRDSKFLRDVQSFSSVAGGGGRLQIGLSLPRRRRRRGGGDHDDLLVRLTAVAGITPTPIGLVGKPGRDADPAWARIPALGCRLRGRAALQAFQSVRTSVKVGNGAARAGWYARASRDHPDRSDAVSTRSTASRSRDDRDGARPHARTGVPHQSDESRADDRPLFFTR
jgi:hypothetical protein